MDYYGQEDLQDAQYPCSCGHCTECGLNFMPTSEELLRWAEEESSYDERTLFEEMEESDVRSKETERSDLLPLPRGQNDGL